MKKRYFLLLIFIICSLSCQRREVEVALPALAVSAIHPRRETIAKQLYYIGVVRAKEEVRVFSRVAGKIHEQFIRKGDSVKAGGLLFSIDRDVVGYKFEKARVEAPISGKVSMIYADIGDTVSAQTPLALLQDDDIVNVRIWAGQKEYVLIEPGQPAYLNLSAFPGEIFLGRVSEISPSFDPTTHTALIEVEFLNPDGLLKPGMFARIEIEVKRMENALTLPHDIIFSDAQGSYVFTVENNQAFKRYINTGLRLDSRMEVISGLSEADLVVSAGAGFLEDGAEVRVIRE